MSFVIRCCLALLLAVNVWVWLRLGLALWLNNSAGLMAWLSRSPGPANMALEGFLILLLPVLIISYFAEKRLRTRHVTLLALVLGVVISQLTFTLFPPWLPKAAHPKAIYMAAGLVSGLVFAAALNFRRPANQTDLTDTANNDGRRKVLTGLGVVTGSVATLATLAGPFHLWRKRNHYIDVEVKSLKDNEMTTAEIGGKPVWILKRSATIIEQLKLKTDHLRDPNSESSQQPLQATNSLRSVREEYFVTIGVCTHLGCAPIYDPDGNEGYQPDGAQFFCPCHGASFDLAGRVTKNSPAATNLTVPKYEFVSDDVVRVFHHSLAETW